MLIEKSQELIELSQKYVKLKDDTYKREGFKTREKQISQAFEKVKDLVQSLRLFRKQGLIIADFKPTVEKLLLKVEDTINKYQEKPESILDPENFSGNELETEINKITARIEKELLQAWKNYINRQKPNTPLDLLNILEQVDSFKLDIARIRELDSQIKSKTEKFPKYQDEFDDINKLIQELNQTWQNLNADNVSEEVKAFLKAAVSNTGAPYDLLTKEVNLWILRHNLNRKLRIYFKG